MITAVIESPHRGDPGRNQDYLRRLIRVCLHANVSPYASHRMLIGAFDDENQEEREAGISAGFAWHVLADFLIVGTDYGISEGMRAGIQNFVAVRGGERARYLNLGQTAESERFATASLANALLIRPR